MGNMIFLGVVKACMVPVQGVVISLAKRQMIISICTKIICHHSVTG